MQLEWNQAGGECSSALRSAHVIDGEKAECQIYCGVCIVGLRVVLSARQRTLTFCFLGSKGGR